MVGFGITGFLIETSYSHKTFHCEEVKSPYFAFFYRFVSNLNEALRGEIDRCLEENNLAKDLFTEIPQWWKLYEDLREKKSLLENKSKAKDLLAKLPANSKNYFIKVLRAYLFNKSLNKFKAKEELHELMRIFPEEINLDGFNSTTKFDQNVSKAFLFLLSELNEDKDLKETVRLVSIFLSERLTTKMVVELRKKYDTNLAYLEFDQKINEVHFAYAHPEVWVPYLKNKKDEKNLDKFIKKSFLLFPEHLFYDPFILNTFLPKNDKERTFLLNNLFPKKESTSSAYIKYQLLKNEEIRKWAMQNNKISKDPFFIYERNYLKKQKNLFQKSLIYSYLLLLTGDTNL